MAELPTEHFTVSDTSSGLYRWLWDRGIVGRSSQGTKHLWYFYGIPDAVVLLEFDTKSSPLDVTATLVTKCDDPVALAEFRALCDANRRKYPQAKNEGKRPRIEKQVATTAAHYGYTNKLVKVADEAVQLMGTSGKTYRKYREKEWFLSERDFKEETGQTIAEYWNSKK